MNDIEIIDYLKEIIQEIEYRHKDEELILVNDITTDKLYYSIKGLLDLYNKEKEKNKLLEKQILEDSSYAMLTKLEAKLKYDINKINEKLLSDEYINNYRTARLKGIRTKCKEILNIIGE